MDKDIGVNQIVLNSLRMKKPQAAKHMNAISKLECIETSFRLDEGDLNAKEIRDILEGQYLVNKTLLDHLLIRNYDDAINEIFNSAVINDKTDLLLIRKTHQLLTRNDVGGKNEGGHFRKNIPILSHIDWVPIHPQEIEEELAKMLKSYYRLRREMDPIMRGCFIHNELIRIYPFEENTEAVARAMLNFELIAGGLPPIPFTMNQADYVQIIRQHIKEQEIKPFYRMVVQIVKDRLEQLIELGKNSE